MTSTSTTISFMLYFTRMGVVGMGIRMNFFILDPDPQKMNAEPQPLATFPA
jgi:hypothetical protein